MTAAGDHSSKFDVERSMFDVHSVLNLTLNPSFSYTLQIKIKSKSTSKKKGAAENQPPLYIYSYVIRIRLFPTRILHVDHGHRAVNQVGQF